MLKGVNQLPLLIRNPSMQVEEENLDFDHFNFIFNEEVENMRHLEDNFFQQNPFLDWVLDQDQQDYGKTDLVLFKDRKVPLLGFLNREIDQIQQEQMDLEEDPFINLQLDIFQDHQIINPFFQQDNLQENKFEDQKVQEFVQPKIFPKQKEYEDLFGGFEAFLYDQEDQEALNQIFPFVFYQDFFPGHEEQRIDIWRRENLRKYRLPQVRQQIKKRQEQLKREEQQEIRKLFFQIPFQEVDLHMKECPICATFDNDLQNLGCKDQYCRPCAKLLLKDLLDNCKVFPQDLICPICQVTISDQVFQHIAGPVQFQRLKDLRESLRVDHLISTGKAIYCPVPGCKGYIHIVNGKISIACAVCRVTICPECKKCTHPNMTCEEYSQCIKGDDEDLEQMMISRSWKRCPFCASIVEKVDGCQFVRCRSKICAGSQYRCICYLCGKGLNEKHHFSHYQINGPFGNTCNTLDGIQDTPNDEDPIVVQQRQLLENQLQQVEQEEDFNLGGLFEEQLNQFTI